MDSSEKFSTKPAAFALTVVFLPLNGLKLTVSAKEGVRFVEQTLIAEKASLPAITDWIEAHVRYSRSDI